MGQYICISLVSDFAAHGQNPRRYDLRSVRVMDHGFYEGEQLRMIPFPYCTAAYGTENGPGIEIVEYEDVTSR